jgi:Zn finger protein HypA/HybF involved in hydrogenase expression
MRTEFPCPNCDAVLSVHNRKEISHQEKAYAIPFLVSGISFMIFIFIIAILICNPYPLPQMTNALIIVSSVLALIFVSLARAMSAAEKNMKLEVVRSRQSCKSCGYVTPIENSSFCPKCGASFHASSQSHLSSCDQDKAPERLCMICGKVLSSFDTVIECPDCGSAFHSVHLVEYLHVHGGCPVCGRHIDEIEIAEKRMQESTQLPGNGMRVEGCIK